jgi:hypothetical protein
MGEVTTRMTLERLAGRAMTNRPHAAQGTAGAGYSEARSAAHGAVQPTIPPWARTISSVACLNAGK